MRLHVGLDDLDALTDSQRAFWWPYVLKRDADPADCTLYVEVACRTDIGRMLAFLVEQGYDQTDRLPVDQAYAHHVASPHAGDLVIAWAGEELVDVLWRAIVDVLNSRGLSST